MHKLSSKVFRQEVEINWVLSLWRMRMHAYIASDTTVYCGALASFCHVVCLCPCICLCLCVTKISSDTTVSSCALAVIVSSVRSSNSHPDLLVIQHPTPFFRSHRSSTLDFHFLSHYSYIKVIMLYKGNHWTRCAGFMDASWLRLGITNDDLGTSWAQPGDNLGMT